MLKVCRQIWDENVCLCVCTFSVNFAFTAVEKHNDYQDKIVLNYLKENKLGMTDPCT